MNSKLFNAAIIILLLSYFLIQLFCLYSNPVGLDEFHNLYLARKTLDLKPYKEWMPFKTTLSLYFDTIPFYFFKDQWDIIHFSKIFRIALTSVTLFFLSKKLQIVATKQNILLGLCLLCFNSNFLSGSLELRPDLLNSLTGFASFVSLLHGNFYLSGLFAVLSFCISQKGLVYFLAANITLLYVVLGDKSKASQLLKFNLIFIIGTISYIGYFSIQSSIDTVVLNIFTKHLYLLTERNYPKVWVNWLTLFLDNFVFFFLSIFSFITFIFKKNRLTSAQIEILIYSFSVFFFCALYPEPMPYFFILFLPILYVLNLIGLEILNSRIQKGLILALGLYPLYVYSSTWKGEQGYQQIMTIIGEHLLKGEERYFSGTSFLTFKEQTPEELSWVDMRMLRHLEQANSEEIQSWLNKIKANPPKFIYSSYKIDNLPKVIVSYFENNYFHYFGNIYIYSEEYEPQNKQIRIAYSGRYLLLSESQVMISGTMLNSGAELTLENKLYDVKSDSKFKLIYKPTLQLDSKYDRYRDART